MALSIAIEKTFLVTPELKWPNDLTINGKKIAGILVDASLESNKIESLVLGVGINFNVNVKEIKKTLKETPNFYGVASLSEQKIDVKPIQLVQIFLEELETLYKALNAKQIEKIISEWSKRSSTIGKNVELNTEDVKIKGRAIRIDEDGALVVLHNDKMHRIIAGDIIHLSK